MSKHASPITGADDPVSLETGLEAFQSSPEFRGPVEALDGHHCNDHFAQIYESDADRFAAAVPFVRHGLEQGERVMYVVDKSSEADIEAALRDGGIDVDAELQSDALSFHTVQETYLRNGEFAPDEMIDFYADTVAEATEEYAGLRIVAETTWLQDDTASVEQFMEYEAKVNELFAETDSLAICQYERDGFPPEVIRDIVRSHPHLIYDGAVCHNVYYTPPAEFFGDDAPAREVDRMLGTLRERTEAKAEVADHKRFLRDLYEITASQDRSFEEKLNALFELGCEQFDIGFGILNRVDPAADHLEIEYASGEHPDYEVGGELPLSETYCRAAVDIEAAADITNPVEEGFDDLFVYEEFGVDAYLGTYIPVAGGADRTLAFVPEESAEMAFSEQDKAFIELMGQWIGYELNRRQREQFISECYEITADPARDFEEKLDALLELGCEQFGLEHGGLARVDPDTDLFEVEYIRGEHDHLVPGEQYPLSETYCRLAAADNETVAVTDPVDAGFDGKLCYQQFGVQTYLGTHLPIDGDVDRTFWFVSNDRRDTPFTEMEETFIHLMGQWVQYELERQQREAELRQTKDRFETVFEDSDDGIFLLDPDADEFVDANPAAAEMNGYTREELLSLAPSDLHPDEMEQFRAFLDKAREQGSAWSEDLHCRHKDGRDIPAEITASPITLNGRDLVLTLVRHIEERKKHERYQRDLYEVTADPDRGFDEKIERLLELGCDRFGLEMAGLNHLPDWDGQFRLEKGVDLGVDPDEEVWTDPGADCYCRRTIESDAPVAMPDVRDTHWTEDDIYREFGVTSYLATKVTSGSTPYGTLWFGSTEARDQPFADAERSFIELMGQWVGYEIERREHNEAQRELYEITADPELDTDEKIERLLVVGCDRLDLPVGMLTCDRGDAFEIEYMHGIHPNLDEGTLTPPLTDNYCRRVVDTGDPIGIPDAAAAGWDGDTLYHEFDLQCYAGTQVTVSDTAYGTLCFTDTQPRQRAFTEAEQAFLDLMGQCVSYELERAEREDRLQALSTLGRELLDTETSEEVAEQAIEIADDTFENRVVTIALYDEETGDLRLAASTEAAADLPMKTLIAQGDGIGWDAFVSSDTQHMTTPFDDVDTAAGTEVSEAVAHPLGTHGVVLVGSTRPSGFHHGDAEATQTEVANLQAALDRADRERKLQEREDTLEEQNETLTRLNRINDTIRSVDQALVEATTRDEIERVVCEELADTGLYELAWIGEYDGVAGEVTPVEWAGAEKGYLDDITITDDDSPEGCGPTGRAIKTGDPQVVNNVLSDESFAPWRQDALNRGYHATAAFPLSYDDSRYGVLNLYAGQPEVFDALEREVLTELSNTVAYAINACESKKALISDAVTELEFTIEEPDIAVMEMTRELDCDSTVERLVPQTDGSVRMFFSVDGAAPDAVREYVPRLPLTDLTLVSDPDDDDSACIFEATLTEESLSRTVIEHGGRLHTAEITDGTATIFVHLATDADTRQFVDMLKAKVPSAELTAQRTKESGKRTAFELTTALTEELTDRQLEVLEMAYFSGYFEEPREHNASEIADTLDIAQPTFTSHLQSGTRKLYRQLFEDELAIE